jgi:hypothetical protein
VLRDVEHAARKMTMVLPTIQKLSAISDGFDQCGSWNQSGPWMPSFGGSCSPGRSPG